MHIIARVLMVAYIALAVFAGIVYGQMVSNELAVTEVQERIDGNVRVAWVEIHWTGNRSEAATASVAFEVKNPGRVAIEVVGVNYEFHMDDPSDPRPWNLAEKLEDTRISMISISDRRGDGYVVAPAGNRTVVTTVRVPSGTPEMVRLDRPDSSGLYHPIVMVPWIVYTFVEFEVFGRPVYMAPYYSQAGVTLSG